ncbi:MarR family winged helix-turn-helix transcriptional regulator [Listeria rustica]|uniref:Winged helix-turn-helix transcriptional regulator n=1 Tax=Listeria rustica TaxID=2713503 RepID=A0A7W1T579_9LIST|nr:MarR family winged helix-turn-helix transcriptional regulator [Listeria rustica]MBA3925685.1 winged helix-turn-helix transcriptional regulator [Listeria rustica]
MAFTEEQLDNFKKLTNSMKKAQRAEILEGNENAIKALYEDPLPQTGVLSKVLHDETTFLIGRRGTGKSTIFSYAQETLREDKGQLSVYIDVKSLHGKTTGMGSETNNKADEMILEQNFISEVLKEIIKEINTSLEKKTVLRKMIGAGKYTKAKGRLKDIKNALLKPEFRDVTITTSDSVEVKEREKSVEGESSGAQISLNRGLPNITAGGNFDKQYQDENEFIRKTSSAMVRDFSITEYMEDIKETLSDLNIKKIFLFLDDFSELGETAQKVFVNVILAPLNNWSDKYFRFKVACYPERIYYGEIDRSKIDEIYLDHYDLYKGAKPDLSEIEEKAQGFLNKLLNKRFIYYLDCKPEIFFNIDSDNTWEDYLEQLFFASMNIPRILGNLLEYAYDKSLVYGNLINRQIILQASKHYYEAKINPFFDKGTMVLESYESRLDRFGQKLLTNSIVDESRKKKRELAKTDLQMFKGLKTIPSSHFYISKEEEHFFNTLELNYVVNKYFEQSDKDGVKSSIYSLNYGLCAENNIDYGRPKGDSKYRKYYIDRQFNYNSLLLGFMRNYKEYECNNCKQRYDLSNYRKVEMVEMLCFKGCREPSTFKEVLLFEEGLPKITIPEEYQLPESEYDALNVINTLSNPYASTVAGELDCSYQMVNSLTKKLEQKQLIEKEEGLIDSKKRKIYKVTELAIQRYNLSADILV